MTHQVPCGECTVHSLKNVESVIVVMIPMLLFNTDYYIVVLSLTKCLGSAQSFVVVYLAY